MIQTMNFRAYTNLQRTLKKLKFIFKVLKKKKF